jgi:hypothetical protein
MENETSNKQETANSDLGAVSGSNPDNVFVTQHEADEYVRKRKEWWGSNLVGWVEEKDGRFFPCFNVGD